MVAPAWTMQGGPPGLAPGPDGLRELFRTFGEIDQKWTMDDVIAEGDRVVVRATNRCVQESFLGVPRHGQRQTFTAILIHRITDGKIFEAWRNADDSRTAPVTRGSDRASEVQAVDTPVGALRGGPTSLSLSDLLLG